LPVAVIGGGDTAMEEAIYLAKLATKVTVIHRRDSLRASKVMQDKAMSTPNISFIWNSEVVGHQGYRSGQGHLARVARHADGVISELEVDGVFIGIGHVPNTALFKGQLAMHDNGYLKTRDGSRTSVRGCSPRATFRTTSIGRRSPLQGPAAWPRSMRSASFRARCTRVTRRKVVKSSLALCTLIDPAAAEDLVSFVEDDGLAGRDCSLGRVELEFGAPSSVPRTFAGAAACDADLRVTRSQSAGASPLIQFTPDAVSDARPRSSRDPTTTCAVAGLISST
jgi:hypothetical protein